MLRWKENLLEIKIVWVFEKPFDFVTLRAKCPKFIPFLAIWKNIRLLQCEQIIYHFKARDLEIPNIYKK